MNSNNMNAVALILLGLVAFAEAQCQFCPNGEDIPGSSYDKAFPVSFPPISTCGDVQAALPILESDSEECAAAAVASSYCGCAVAEGSCLLCEEGMTLEGDHTDLLDYPTSDYISAYTGNLTMTCGLMESYLHTLTAESNDCSIITEDVLKSCTCFEKVTEAASETAPPDQSSGATTKNIEYVSTAVMMMSAMAYL